MTFTWVRPKQTPDDEVELFSLGSMRSADGTVLAEDDSGEVFGGRYELLEAIACGGTAAVYRSRDLHTGAQLAVKVLYTGAREQIAQYFWQEGRLAARIRNPHLVHASDFGEDDGRLFIVFDLVPGRSLPELYSEPMPWRELLEVVRQILKALAALHARGVVHRDVKPDNVIVSRTLGELHVTLLDMGFAAVAPEKRITGSPEPCRRVFGTFGFIAPELLAGIQPEPRCDLYSLGALMYTMLTAQPVPDLRPAPEVIMIPPPSAFMPDLPAAVDDLVMRALSDVEARFQSAREMAEAVRAAQASSGDSPRAVVQRAPSEEPELRPFREPPESAPSMSVQPDGSDVRPEAAASPATTRSGAVVGPRRRKSVVIGLTGAAVGAALTLAVNAGLAARTDAGPIPVPVEEEHVVERHADLGEPAAPCPPTIPPASIAAPASDSEVLPRTAPVTAAIADAGVRRAPVRVAPRAARKATSFAGAMTELAPRIEGCLMKASLERKPYTVQVRFVPESGEVDQVRVIKLDQQHDFTRCVDRVIRSARPPAAGLPNESFTFFSSPGGSASK